MKDRIKHMDNKLYINTAFAAHKLRIGLQTMRNYLVMGIFETAIKTGDKWWVTSKEITMYQSGRKSLKNQLLKKKSKSI